jgi:hypothetical protein
MALARWFGFERRNPLRWARWEFGRKLLLDRFSAPPFDFSEMAQVRVDYQLRGALRDEGAGRSVVANMHPRRRSTPARPTGPARPAPGPSMTTAVA